MISLIGWKFKIMVAVMLSSFLIASWYYVKNLQAEIKASELRESKYQETIAAKDEETQSIRRDLDSMVKSQKKLSEEIKAASSNVNNLEKKFTQNKQGEPRNIRSDALSKPAAIENAINRGTRDALRCGEITTGSPLTANEKSGKVTNTICPDLVKVDKK